MGMRTLRIAGMVALHGKGVTDPKRYTSLLKRNWRGKQLTDQEQDELQAMEISNSLARMQSKQAFLAGYMDKSAKTKKLEEWDSAEAAQFEKKHGGRSQYGVSFKKDKQGYFCHTHRGRSKSKPTPDGITKTELKFIESTG